MLFKYKYCCYSNRVNLFIKAFVAVFFKYLAEKHYESHKYIYRLNVFEFGLH